MTDKSSKTGMSPAATIGLEASRTGVQKVYSDMVVLGDLRRKHAAGMSLRQIAAEYDGITHADIQRALRGHLPHDPHKRIALHLAPMLPAPACPRCSTVHTTRRCTRRTVRWSDTRLEERPPWLLKWYLDNRETA